MRGDLQRVHMIGIGGAGMSGIARILLARGSVVSGSDMKESRSVVALKASGAQVAIGHHADNLELSGELPTVVVTSFAAIPQDNPELVRAREQGIPILRRSDVLALLMENSRSFLLAGTHGKTSTTSMAVVAAQTAGMDPSFAIGGQLNKAGTNAHQGSGDIFIAEADESDGSFLSYSPTVAVITNIEPDHLDYFGTAEAYYEVFERFAGCVLPGGAIVLCLDDPGAVHLAQKIVAGEVSCAEGVHIFGYGTAAAAKAHPEIPCAATITAIRTNPRGGSTATVELSDELYPQQEPLLIDVAIPGEHMVLNAVAACVGGIFLGASPIDFAEGISQFDGVRRRFEQHIRLNSGSLEGVSVYDDYAHHPTEVSAVLRAARALVEQQGKGRVIAIFQPHLYSRTINFAAEFAEALSLADRAYVLEIFGARENPVEGVDSRILTDKITVPARYLSDFSSVADTVVADLEPYDVVLTIGAGTVTMIAPELVRVLMERL